MRVPAAGAGAGMGHLTLCAAACRLWMGTEPRLTAFRGNRCHSAARGVVQQTPHHAPGVYVGSWPLRRSMGLYASC